MACVHIEQRSPCRDSKMRSTTCKNGYRVDEAAEHVIIVQELQSGFPCGCTLGNAVVHRPANTTAGWWQWW